MPARHVLIANGPAINPGAVATPQAWTVTGKTQGPCDYLDAHISAGFTGATTLLNGLSDGIDRIEVTINRSGDSTDGDTGSVFYTLFGTGNMAYAAGGKASRGMLETVSRMLFKAPIYNTNLARAPSQPTSRAAS